MTPRGTYGPETTYASLDVSQTVWVARASEPYLIDYTALLRIVGDGAT